MVKIHLHATTWNEDYMLDYFFRHYDPLVDRYFFYDDGSTDGTLDRIKRHPRAEVRPFERTHSDSFVLSHLDFQNDCWKQSRGQCDWVILTAIDEFLYHPNLKAYIQICQKHGVTCLPALGYQMVSRERPGPDENLTQTRTLGAPWLLMCKLSLFRPEEILETNFQPGRHTANPTGNFVVPHRDELMLLHYKMLGFEEAFARNQFLKGGLGSKDSEEKWGYHYDWDRRAFEEEWVSYEAYQRNIAVKGFNPAVAELEDRWWNQSGGQDRPSSIKDGFSGAAYGQPPAADDFWDGMDSEGQNPLLW